MRIASLHDKTGSSYDFVLAKNTMDNQILKGLSESVATERLRLEGYNELPSARPRGFLQLAAEVLKEPMLLLLVAAGTIYLLLGDLKEALVLVWAIFLVIGITLYQERKTERALQALRDLSSPRALVIRDGIRKRIPGREVARGDTVILNEGDRVPADALIHSSINLSADESLLTGESVPVHKSAWDGSLTWGRPGGDDLPFVFSGTLITQGQGIAVVQATGIRTEFGKIGKALQTIEPGKTSLERETGRMVRVLALIGLALCSLVTVVYALNRGSWLKGILAGLTMAISMLPEEMPVVLMIFLALGAWRISKNQVLTRRIPAIESLGAATVLCVDKTGTLTMNRMAVAAFFVDGEFREVDGSGRLPLPEKFHRVLEYSMLASKSDAFDPMDRAFQDLALKHFQETEHLHVDWKMVREYPLSRKLLAVSQVWQSSDNQVLEVAAKGAPEAIGTLCGFSESQMRELSVQADGMASRGLRVLGVACALHDGGPLPDANREFSFEFLGLVGLADPLRPGVREAIRECYDAGIRVLMITGDYPGTASNIARQIGLANPGEIVTGSELDVMDHAELERRTKTVNIFARVVPEQKLRLVNALKAGGEVVAMTGDGVNDAPALKAANIGIAMGGRGTDVAREAASLVLLDDDFSSIVKAVRLGRRIFDNIRKAMAYIFAIHVPIAGMSLIPVTLNWPLVLMPLHIVFLEMIIDPACSVAFEMEREEEEIMRRPPRNPKEPLFGTKSIILSLMQGVSVLVTVLGVYVVSMYRGQGELDARALTFTTLIVGNLALILTNRSWTQSIWSTLKRSNPAIGWLVGGALTVLAAVLYVPFLRDLFRFSKLHPIDIAICFASGLAGVAWFEVLKMTMRRHMAKPFSKFP